MRRIVVALTLGALAGCSIGTDLPLADRAVTRFHKLLDAGQFDAIYNGAAGEMKAAASSTKLEALLSAVHRKLGLTQKSERQGFNDQVNMSGHFVTMTYRTVYQHGEAMETFVYKIAGGQPALAGYNVNSDALITG